MSIGEIETGIPIPPARNERLKGIRLDDLSVGQSRIVAKSRRGSLSAAIRCQKAKTPGWDFTTRVIDPNTIRVWRIA